MGEASLLTTFRDCLWVPSYKCVCFVSSGPILCHHIYKTHEIWYEQHSQLFFYFMPLISAGCTDVSKKEGLVSVLCNFESCLCRCSHFFVITCIFFMDIIAIKRVQLTLCRGDTAPLILNLDFRWETVVTVTLRLFTLEQIATRRLSDEHSRVGRCREENVSNICRKSSHDSMVVQPVV